jgi:hypothetical protein
VRLGPVPCLLLLGGVALAAQSWLTFFSAYDDGLAAQAKGDPDGARRAFEQAIALEPNPGIRVKTYGLNFLPAYYPYLRLAQACLAQGDLARADWALARSAAFGVEPAAERETLRGALRARRPAPAAAAPAVALAAGATVAPAQPPARPAPAPAEVPGPAVQEAPTVVAGPGPAMQPRAAALPALAKPAPSPAVLHAAPAQGAAAPSTASSPAPRRRGPRWQVLGLLGFVGAMGAGWLGRRSRKGAPQASPQRTFGPYRTRAVLGHGGSATAFEAVHATTGVTVALKVPHPHLLQNPDFRARFQREASLGARLDHPRIVRILDSGVQDGEPWLAMTFMRGETLEARLRAQGALPVPEALAILSGLAEAVAYAHARGVVHRDLKPANLMLTPEGVMVMDFGIARFLDASLTTSSMFLGTPRYAAPECVSTTQVGPPADLYAMGIILFEMLAGHPPFTGNSPFQVLEAQCSQPLPELGTLRPEAPAELLRLLERLCAKAPEARPLDGEVVTLLASLSSSEPRRAGALPEYGR